MKRVLSVQKGNQSINQRIETNDDPQHKYTKNTVQTHNQTLVGVLPQRSGAGQFGRLRPVARLIEHLIDSRGGSIRGKKAF
jgi:hypothetical protein